MDRREFLRAAGLAVGTLGLGGLLQACGGAAAPASSAAPPATSAGGAPSAAASAKPAGSASAKPSAASAKPGASAAASAAAKPGGKLVVSYGSVAGSFWPLWMAKELGGFDKYGVNVEMPLIETNAAVAAEIANQLDVMEVSAAPIIGADVNGNVDLVMIASALNHPILGLYTTPDITNADQLKGKAIASGPPGSPVDYSAKLSLSLLGLKPSDVQLRSIGTAEQITAALLSGQMQAGMVAPPQTFQVEAKGFKLLKNIFSQPYQNVALVARRSRLDQLAPQLKPLLAAYRDGIANIYDQPDQAIKVLDKYAKVGDQDILKKTLDFYTNPSFAPFQKDMQPTTEGIQAMIDFLAETSPNIKGHKPAEYVDLRFLNDLPK
ncbi:MAG TPA: ABC transporter substrate-binding protein [Chloroflexota bacterium]|nr:ABC transporter substrate-binding protein [Chloroflexota bacterium]